MVCPDPSSETLLTLQSTQLTTSQLADYKEAFRLFDRDNDGFIHTKDLGIVIRSLGSNPTNAAIHDIIAELKAEDDLVDFETVCIVYPLDESN